MTDMSRILAITKKQGEREVEKLERRLRDSDHQIKNLRADTSALLNAAQQVALWLSDNGYAGPRAKALDDAIEMVINGIDTGGAK